MSDGLCSLRLTRRYAATPEEVWNALSDPESLSRWLAVPHMIELRRGGRFELESVGGGRVEARVREIEPGQVLELDWRYGGEEPSIVRFELSEDGEETVLVLEHSRIDESLGMAYIARWTGAVERLGERIAR
ncbi:MAG: SRPBCC domain-containing protein [Solirubrobacteraceae bacterium]